MSALEKGQTLQTKKGKTITIDREIGEGSIGKIYIVDYDGNKKALKWFSARKLKEPQQVYDNLEDDVKTGKPFDSFIWPEDVTEFNSEAFGCIMDLKPMEFQSFSHFLTGKTRFTSVDAMINTSLNITESVQSLHKKGYYFLDMSTDFYINPENGTVLFTANDNVSKAGKYSGVSGSVRFMAPEIVAKGAKPNAQSDLYSLSVTLFLLWAASHPLEGKSSISADLSSSAEKKIYGENPVFIFDPDDDSNRPVEGIHKGAITRWPVLPGYLKEGFCKAFGKKALSDPSLRVIEEEWLKIFNRMKEEGYKG